jgi:hypothetical protein
VKTTSLASGKINSDALSVELIEPSNEPPTVKINWPAAPTVTTPTAFDRAVSDAMKVLSNAVIELAALKLGRKR